MINEIAIECFLEACEMRNFTKVSEKLYMTMQNVSKHICALERDLGVELFIRTPSQLEMTPAAEIYYEYFINLKKEWRKTRKKVQEITGQKVTNVNLWYQSALNLEVKTLGQIQSLINRKATVADSIRFVPNKWENRAAVETMVEMGNGFTICTSLERLPLSREMKCFKLGYESNIICAWRKNETREGVHIVVDIIRNHMTNV